MLLTWWLLVLTGCQAVSHLGPVHLEEPGWTVRQGQAVWQRPHAAPEIAGEILLATQQGGQSVVQFSKGGFPFLIAQKQAHYWEVELPAQNKRYSGRGLPPRRLLILHLPNALAGGPLPADFSWKTIAGGRWRLENYRQGESLEGYFDP